MKTLPIIKIVLDLRDPDNPFIPADNRSRLLIRHLMGADLIALNKEGMLEVGALAEAHNWKTIIL